MPQNGDTPLLYATRVGEVVIVRYLMECNADVNVTGKVKHRTDSNRLLVWFNWLAELWVL